MKKLFLCLSAQLILNSISISNELNVKNMNITQNKENFVFATYVSNYTQVRKAYQLIKSIRNSAGKYSHCEIYIGLSDTNSFSFDLLKSKDVKFVYLDVPAEATNYCFAIKAYAAAQIEKDLNKSIKTLAWFDPETIVTGPVDDLELKQGYSAAIRPVFLMNKIGIKPDEEANEYWGKILNYFNLNVEDMPIVETEVDLVNTRAYYNCGIFSVKPSLGIMQEWARVQTVFLKDNEYQKKACGDIMRKIFFHQIVFSCVVCFRIKQNEIYSLPMTCGYPLDLQQRMPAEKKINKLNDLSCAIIEDLWDKNPKWMKDYVVEDPLKTLLQHATQEYLTIGN